MNRTFVTRAHYDELKRRFLAGATWHELAASHYVRTNKLPREPRALWCRMRCFARRIEDTWPWDPERSTRSGLTRSRNITHYRSGSAELIKLELSDFKEWSGITYKQIADEADLHPCTVWKIMSGHSPRIAKQTADKIMKVIETYERKLAA